MRELSHETLEEFGLTVQRSSREFGAYLCETEAGLYLVKSVDNSERELRLAHQVPFQCTGTAPVHQGFKIILHTVCTHPLFIGFPFSKLPAEITPHLPQ